MRATLLLFVGLLASIATNGAEQSSGAFVPVPAYIQELVFRKELATASDKDVYCLSVDGHDPEPQVLSLVQRKDISIVAASECVAASDILRGSYRRSNYQAATFISIGQYKVVNDSTGSLTVEFYHDGLDASGGTLLLRKTGDGWQVERSGYFWQS
jgi:hypothetical protein